MPFYLQTEVEWLLRNIPAVLTGVRSGTRGLHAVVRDEFRRPGQLTTHVSSHHLLTFLLASVCLTTHISATLVLTHVTHTHSVSLVPDSCIQPLFNAVIKAALDHQGTDKKALIKVVA